jgi:VIT1/CCC1 family predicted Fe2+/Mn2+ transporter
MARRTLLTELSHYLRDRQSRRKWSLAAQDGIIATAGILLGFAGAGAREGTLIVAGTAATVAGMLSAGGAEWAEAAAEREAQLSALEEERAELQDHRDIERIEVIQYYEQKGLSEELAIQVANQLMVRSPLKAVLEKEHGILQLMSRAEVLFSGIGSAIAYALGAAIPFAMTFFLPVSIEIWVIFLTALLSLSLISIVGARAGHMNVSKTIIRTLAVGAVTIIVSFFVGEIAF